MAEARGGVRFFSGSGAPSRGRRQELPIDEARRLPHLRSVQPVSFNPGGIDTMPAESLGQLTVSEQKFQFPMPQDLRGIPVVGPGVGGVQPGTNPERATITKLSRERAA